MQGGTGVSHKGGPAPDYTGTIRGLEGYAMRPETPHHSGIMLIRCPVKPRNALVALPKNRSSFGEDNQVGHRQRQRCA